MSASSVTIEATFGSGNSLSVLADLIAKRQQFLNGETTERAVKATAINILTSLRARTKKAKPTDAKFGYKVVTANDVVAGFENRKRVVRTIGGHSMSSVKITNLVGNYKRGEVVNCYIVIFKSPKFSERYESGYTRCYVLARTSKDVEKWAEKRLKNYINVYSGMAKWAIGQAQSQIAQQGQNIQVSNAARNTALQNIFVSVAGNGYSNGNFSVEVKDTLGYATIALQGGTGDFEMSVKKAANRTAALINKTASYALDEEIPTPFPEVRGVN